MLHYRGELPAKSRPEIKLRIQRVLHPQLVRLWEMDQTLLIQRDCLWETDSDNRPLRYIDSVYRRFRRGDFACFPLATRELKLICTINVTLYRREEPGALVNKGGDIDNRVKVLLDSLRVPDASWTKDQHPEPHEQPFYCLMEDDSQITSFSVTTERWLEPFGPDERETDVLATITADIRPKEVTLGNSSFL